MGAGPGPAGAPGERGGRLTDRGRAGSAGCRGPGRSPSRGAAGCRAALAEPRRKARPRRAGRAGARGGRGAAEAPSAPPPRARSWCASLPPGRGCARGPGAPTRCGPALAGRWCHGRGSRCRADRDPDLSVCLPPSCAGRRAEPARGGRAPGAATSHGAARAAGPALAARAGRPVCTSPGETAGSGPCVRVAAGGAGEGPLSVDLMMFQMGTPERS